MVLNVHFDFKLKPDGAVNNGEDCPFDLGFCLSEPTKSAYPFLYEEGSPSNWQPIRRAVGWG